MLIFWSLVRNSVVLAVYLLFSVACFLTVHEHLRRACFQLYKCSFCIFAQRRGYFGGVGAVLRMTTTLCVTSVPGMV